MGSSQGLKSGRCPKCNSDEVYTSKNKKKFGHRSYLIVSPFSVNIALDTYVCAACGYVEDYLNEKIINNNSKHIKKLKDKWQKVS